MAFSNSRMATNLFCSTPNDRQNQKRARVGSNTCPKCESTLKDTSEYQTCSVCELDFCIKCTGISTALMCALQEDTTNNFMWTCNCCKQNFPSMTSMKTQLKSIEDSTHVRLTRLEDNMMEINSNINTKVKYEMQSMKPDLINEIKQEIKTSLQDDVRKEVREIEDQKIRSLNLIIFNMQESEDKSGTVRKDFDMNRFMELCSRIGVKDVDVKTLFRLGITGQKKSRPLKVVLNSKKHRKDILDSVSKIKNLATETELNKCIIVKDLTVQQREANKKRRTEINAQNKQKGRNQQPNSRKDNNVVGRMYTVKQKDCDQSEETMDVTIQPLQSQSQPILAPLSGAIGTRDDIRTVLSLSSIGDDTIIGGYETQQADGIDCLPENEK